MNEGVIVDGTAPSRWQHSLEQNLVQQFADNVPMRRGTEAAPGFSTQQQNVE